MEYREYTIGDIFSTERCPNTKKEMLIDGDTPYVTRTCFNNGVQQYCGNENGRTAGNCIIIGGESHYAFYQKDEFVSGNNITALRSPRLNEMNGLYLCTALNRNSSKYSYSKAWNQQRINGDSIMLPVRTVPSPDYAMIDSMMIGGGIEMSNIDTSNWSELRIGDVFEKIDTGKINGKAGDFPTSRDAEHEIPLLTSSSQNQGLTRFAPRSACPTILSNVISVASNGAAGETFYQEDEFAVLQDAYAIRSIGQDIPNRECGLFLASVIGARLRGNFDWSNKANWPKVRELKIKLPVIETEEIDWRYMEERIAELEAERIAKLEAYLAETGLNDYELTEEDKEILSTKLIDSSKQVGQSQSTISGDGCWKEAREFKVGDLFKSSTGDVDLQQKDIDNEGIYFINSGVQNCGIKGKTSREAKVFPANTITIDFFGNAYYRDFEYKLATHNHVFSLSGNYIKNEKVGVYLATILSKMSNLFCYNNMLTWSKLKVMHIPLPINENGAPDYDYMEKYIRAIEKLTIVNVIKYKDSMIKATKKIVGA